MGNHRNPPLNAHHFPPLGVGVGVGVGLKKASTKFNPQKPWKSALISGLFPTEAPKQTPPPLDRKGIEEIWAAYPPPYDISDIDPEPITILEDDDPRASLPRPSPWLSNVGNFHEPIIITRADLALTHLEQVNMVDGVLHLDADDIVPVHLSWGYCLLGFFAGKFPGVMAIQKLADTWICCPKISFHSSGWIVFRFEFEEERETVLHAGPYHISGVHLNLCHLPEFFRFDNDTDFKFPASVCSQDNCRYCNSH